jgi:RNA polymerase sigma-70 factor (ECF subfamily)
MNWDELVRDTHALVYRIALGILRRPAEAEDASQDVYLDFLRNPGPLEAAEDRKAFVARCAVNRALKRLRGDARRARREEAARRAEEGGMDPVETAFRREVRLRVAELPEDERLAVDLHYMQGLTLAQTATALEVTDRTVSNRLREGLTRLRRALGAAAFAALLARLEGELSACGAEEVPAGLAARLRGLSRGPVIPAPPAVLRTGTEHAASRWAAAAAVVLLILLSSLVGWRIVAARDGGTRGFAGEPGEQSAAVPEPGGAVTGASRQDTAPPADGVDRERDLHGVVVDEGGAPVAGALVEAIYRPRRGMRPASREERAAEARGLSARSREDGTFAVRLKPGDRVDVRAGAAGFATVDVPLCAAGEKLRIVLPPGVSLAVTVVNEGGRPVKDARLHLVRRLKTNIDLEMFFRWTEARHEEGDFGRRGTSDAEGRCVFADLPAGAPVFLGAAHDEYADAVAQLDLPTRGEGALEVRVLAGRVVRGRVLDDATGEPIAGATVRRPEDFMNLYRSRPGETAAVTGRDGTFTLRGWNYEDGGTMPLASADGYATRNAVPSGQDEFEARLPRVPSIGGRIVDGEGNPVSGARVRIGDSLNDAGAGTTGPEGRFRIAVDDVSEATVLEFHAQAQGFGDAKRWVPNPSADSDIGDVTLPAARVVAGRVTGADGEPVAREKIVLRAGSAGAPLDPAFEGPSTLEATLTDDLGRFRFGSIAPGEYTLIVHARRRPEARLAVAVPEDADVAGLEVRLEAGRRIRIRVSDDAGAPLADVSVQVESFTDRVSTRSGADGTATVEMSGEQIQVSAGDGPPGTMPPERVTLAPGATDVELVFRRGEVLEGIVVDDRGRPLAANLTIVADGLPAFSTFTDREGKFRATGPTATVVDLVVEAVPDRNYADLGLAQPYRVKKSFERVNPGSRDLRLVVPVPVFDKTLKCRVTTPDGTPVSGVEVGALAPDGAFFRAPFTGADGRVELKALPSSEISIQANPFGRPGYAKGAVVKVVAEGQEVELTLEVAAETENSEEPE